MRPTTRIKEFVPSGSPGLHFFPHILGNTRARNDKIYKPAHIIFMRLADPGAGSVIALWIIIICADKIRGKPTVVVNVSFAVGHPNWVPEIIKHGFATGSNQGFK